MNDKPSFFAELQRRHVYKVGAMYGVAGWLLVQVVTQVLPVFDVSALGQRILVLIVVAGFPVALVLAWLFDLTPAGIVRTPGAAAGGETAAAASLRHGMDRKLNYLLGTLLVLALGYFVVERVALRGRGAAVAASDQSIAVLPLLNESGDRDQQYFSDGLSEDFINALSQVAGLKVISRNSSFQFRDSKLDARAIGARLGVAHLLEGSVRRLGETVRISAELVNTADDRTLWSQHYDRPYADLFKLQDDVTADVAGALQARLVGEAGMMTQSGRPASGNLAAYNAYLQGKFHEVRRNSDDAQSAVGYFREAVRLDPRYAQGYAALCYNLVFLAGNYWQDQQARQGYSDARAACATAQSLAPDLAAAYVASSGLKLIADFDWASSQADAQRALQLAPNDADVLGQAGLMQFALGQRQQALARLQQSLVANPLGAATYLWYSRCLMALGRFDEAQQAIGKSIELAPGSGNSFFQLVMLDVLRGDAQAASQDAQRTPAGEFKDIVLAFAAQLGTDRAAADQALQKLIDRESGVDAYQIAQLYALRKQPDQMMAWLERAYSNRDPGLSVLFATDALLDPYRGDPRLVAFCRRVGLPLAQGA